MSLSVKEKVLLGVSVIALLGSIGAFLWGGYLEKQKVAYIRSSALVYGYFGMTEAHKKLTEKEDGWKANIDTLKGDYEKTLNKYRSEASGLSTREKEDREKYLMTQKQSIESYNMAINKKIQEEDDKLTSGVLNQINAFVADYGKQHGYDMIIGTTESGNLLYGRPDMDITETVLKELNKNYKGDSSQ